MHANLPMAEWSSKALPLYARRRYALGPSSGRKTLIDHRQFVTPATILQESFCSTLSNARASSTSPILTNLDLRFGDAWNGQNYSLVVAVPAVRRLASYHVRSSIETHLSALVVSIPLRSLRMNCSFAFSPKPQFSEHGL